LITQAVSSMAGSSLHLRLELAGSLPPVRLDPRQGRELIDNLLMLVRPLATESSCAVVRTSAWETSGTLFEVLVCPDPPEGVLGAGSELSIESARQIAQAHGGRLECDGEMGGEFRVRVMLP
jgi:hypothetical protein